MIPTCYFRVLEFWTAILELETQVFIVVKLIETVL